MRPYYEEDGITIYHGDCRELLPALARDTAIGAIITDPPYGIDYKAVSINSLPGGSRIAHDKVSGDAQPFEPSHILALNVPTILWGANNFAARLPDSNGWIIWDKRDGAEPDAFFGDAELAWSNLRGGPRIVRYPWASHVQRISNGRWHGTQKPVAVMRWCIDRISWITGPAKLREWSGPVFDPYAGSGSTLCAAKLLRRPAVGIEIEEKFCEIAARRLGQQVFQF